MQTRPPLPNPLLPRRRGRAPLAGAVSTQSAGPSPSPPREERVGERRPFSWRLAMNRTLALALTVFGTVQPAPGADTPKAVEVKVTRPIRGDIIRYVSLPGAIRANQQATLYAKVAGYLKSLN